MRRMRVWWQRGRSLFRRARADAELEKELAFHLEQLTREFAAGGMAPGEARCAARRAMGGAAQIEEQCRDQRRVGWLVDLGKDARYAWRMLRKSPGFSALAITTLALGVGASIAVYALAEAFLLRMLPYPQPERLVSLTDVHVRRGESGVGQDNFRDWQRTNTVFERMAFSEFSQVTVTGLGEAERITGRAVSEGFFEMLGVPPERGRWFTAEEQKPGAAGVVMLSHGFWMRKMGARPDAVGSTIFVNDRAYRVVGIMPRSFWFSPGGVAEYWTPVTYRSYGRQQHQYGAWARLKPGVSVAAAQAQMSQIARRLSQTYPDDAGWSVRVKSLRSDFLEGFGPALEVFGAAALIVLLVGCGNVASLLLARGIGRSKEIAVRMALGAGRRRVIRLLLTETLLLAGLGAAGGILFAAWLLRLALAAAPPWLQLGEMLSVSPTLAAFAVGLTMATGLLTGLWPALGGSRGDVQNDLKESGNSLVANRRQARAFHGLVVMEIALAVVLLSFAGLLARSFANLLRTNLGYRTDHLLTFRMPLPASRYRSDAARLQFWETLLPRLAAAPGVISAAASDSIPLGGTYSGTPVEVEGQGRARDWADVMTRAASVSPGYFGAMGIALRAGRGFEAGDTALSEPVAIVNETFARQLLAGREPVGTRVRTGNDPWRRIVGVIADTRYNGPAERIGPEAYVPFTQDPFLLFVVLRTAVPEESVMGAARAVIRGLDPGLPMTQVRTMRESIDLSMTLDREMTALITGFAGISLALAALGLAGVIGYTVSRRKREIGLRMALGARGGDVARGVIRGAARLVLAGSLIGVPCAWAASRLVESLLFGVRAHDPVVLVMAPLVLAGVALLACVAPARRAAAVDPMSALRQE